MNVLPKFWNIPSVNCCSDEEKLYIKHTYYKINHIFISKKCKHRKIMQSRTVEILGSSSNKVCWQTHRYLGWWCVAGVTVSPTLTLWWRKQEHMGCQGPSSWPGNGMLTEGEERGRVHPSPQMSCVLQLPFPVPSRACLQPAMTLALALGCGPHHPPGLLWHLSLFPASF